MRIPRFVRTLRWRVHHAQMWVHHRLHLYQSPKRLASDAKAYWAQQPGQGIAGDLFHLRGDGPFQDDAVWQQLGREHFEQFEELACMIGFAHPVARTLEWGVGGGANAVHFARDAEEFVGVDVSQAALDECAVQMQREGVTNFVPALVDLQDYSDVVGRYAGACDLVISYYVVEILPSREYAVEMLAAFERLLRPGGMVLVQVKYATAELKTHGRPWGYASHPAAATTFAIDEFWTLADDLGLTPRAIVLKPKAPEVHDERYAYYALTKPA